MFPNRFTCEVSQRKVAERMENNQLIAAIIEAVSWPIATLIGIYLLRGQLSRMIDLVRAIRFRGLELELGQEIASIRQQVITSPSLQDPTHQYPPNLPPSLLTLAAISPRATIIEAWKETQHAILAAAQAQEIPLSPGTQVDYALLVRELDQKGIFKGTKTALLIPRVQRLVTVLTADLNKPIPIDIALELADISFELAMTIRDVADAPKPPA